MDLLPEEASPDAPEQPTQSSQNQPAPSSVYPQPVAPASPMVAPTDPMMGKHQPSSAGTLILQWLTYAFWGWTVLALSSLTVSILTSFFLDTETGEFTAYTIAAVLVLLPVAFVCDLFYSRKEPAKKTGPALAVMVIHAVIFALIAMGSLITAVFMLVSMLISAGGTEEKVVAFVSALIVFIYYLLTFVRILNPAKIKNLAKVFRLGMLGTVGIIIVLGIVGPVMQERNLRDEKLIETNLDNLAQSINRYAEDNDELPSSLSDLDLKGDTKAMVSKNLIEYKPDVKPAKSDLNSNTNSRLNYSTTKNYYYELCATFKKESSYYESSSRGNDYTSSYAYGYSHPKGYYCYKLKTTSYSSTFDL